MVPQLYEKYLTMLWNRLSKALKSDQKPGLFQINRVFFLVKSAIKADVIKRFNYIFRFLPDFY